MIVRYAYRQNSIFHNKSQGHKQRTQVLERKESQANHIPIIICRRNSKIVSKEITDKSTTGSQKGQRAKQPSFLQFFPTSQMSSNSFHPLISNLIHFLLSKIQWKHNVLNISSLNALLNVLSFFFFPDISLHYLFKVMDYYYFFFFNKSSFTCQK